MSRMVGGNRQASGVVCETGWLAGAGRLRAWVRKQEAFEEWRVQVAERRVV